MFVAHYSNTMRNARPKFVEPIQVRTIDEIRVEKRQEAERARIAEIVKRQREEERQRREDRRREILAKIENAMRRYRDDRQPLAEKIPIRDILRAICEFHNVTIDQLMARGRQRHMVKVRHEAIRAVADARPDMSLPEIGRVFDNRDHTTILYSLRLTAKPGYDYRGYALANTASERKEP